MWTQVQQWGYISDEKKNPFDLVKLPSLILVSQPMFTVAECLDIIREANEPFKTMFRILAETGMRGGKCAG